MIEMDIQIPGNFMSQMAEIDDAIQRGMNNAVRESAQKAFSLVGPLIPIHTGQTRARLRVTYSKSKGLLTARVGVRAPRKHIMRFYEEGTKSHGRHGGPLPAHHVLAGVRTIIQPGMRGLVEANIRLELAKFGL